MSEAYKSVFHEEIRVHMELRREELGHEAYRHYKRTVKLFDDYLCQIKHRKKKSQNLLLRNGLKKLAKVFQ